MFHEFRFASGCVNAHVQGADYTYIQRKEKVNQSEHSRVFGMFKGLNGIWVIL